MTTPARQGARPPKRLLTANLKKLAREPVVLSRRSELAVALEPHRDAIFAALAAGHTPHAIARALVEDEAGDADDGTTWSRQAVQRVIRRMRDSAQAPAPAARGDKPAAGLVRSGPSSTPPEHVVPTSSPAQSSSFANATRRP